jgi:HdeA/HdeB family
MNGKTAAILLLNLLVACEQMQSPEATAPPPPPSAEAAPPSSPQAAAPPSPQAPALAPAQAGAAASAPTDHIVDIQRATCQNLLGLSPEDRDAASMFYIGYEASRLRARTIDVGMIPSIEGQAVTYCAENPDRTVFQAFAEAYSRTRR